MHTKAKTAALVPLLAVASLLVLASCASAPEPAAKAPDWTLDTPKPDATNTYFTGYAASDSGDFAVASDDAAANLIAGIMQYIGVKVSVDSAATARATLNSYEADIKQTVTTQATNKLSGFQVKERYVYTDKKTGKVTVYILASYATADLDKEKKRIAAAFQEQVDAVAKPEAEGRAFIESGRAYDAFRKFVEAAVAASGADIDNADIKLERNLNSARTALSRIRFDKAGSEAGLKVLIGQPFPKPFSLRLVSGEGASAPGIPGAALLVSYQRKSGTRLVSKTESTVTDPSGALNFSPPPPDFVGKAKLTVKLDLQSSMDLLDKLPAKYGSFRDSVTEDLKGKYVELPYEVQSNARNVLTAIAIVDLDESGAVVAGAQTQAGLVEALVREKFQVRALAMDQGSLALMDDAAVGAAATAAKIDRVVYGTARIEKVRKDGTSYIADARATIKAMEFSTGAMLYSAEKSGTGIGSDEQTARRAAYRDLGSSSIGKDLLASLP